MEAYEAIGANPYTYSVLAVLEEGASDTQAKIADALATTAVVVGPAR